MLAMPDDQPRRPICASTMWVIASQPGVLLSLLAAGAVVVDGRNGRMGLRLALNPKKLPPDADEPACGE